MFPPKQLRLIVQLTNVELLRDNKPTTTVGEILKLFGIMIMITQFEFGARSELWCTTQRSKYIPTPSLGRTGTPCHRFDSLFKNIQFSHQPREKPDGMYYERYRWMCVDESISRWYGQGGDWITIGLPMYVTID